MKARIMSLIALLLIVIAAITGCGKITESSDQSAGGGSDPVSTVGVALVNLRTAGDFVILAETGVTTTGTPNSIVVGNVGVSAITGMAITGFAVSMDASNQFATAPNISGNVYAADYADPTPAKMTAAILDMQAAYDFAKDRTSPDVTELGAGDISGLTITPGLYKWGTGVIINTGATSNGVVLSGGANDVWIFQIAGTLALGTSANVTLTGGATADHVFWQVAGSTTLDTESDLKGIVLCKTAITMTAGAKITGRALAQTNVTMISNTVTQP